MKNKVDIVLIKSMFVNILLVIFKIIVGIIGKSQAMIADGINSVSDLTTDFIAIFGNHMSNKPASDKHPFGYGQIEYLTSLLVGIFVLIMGICLVVQAVTSDISIPSTIVLVVSIVVFIFKYSFSYYLLKKGEEYQNSILIASGIESKMAAMTTLFVIIAYIFSRLGPYASIYYYSDNVCTFVIGFYVIYVSFGIIRDNVIDVIGTNCDNEYIDKIKKRVLSYEEVMDVKDINLLKYGSYYSADIEIVCKKSMRLSDIDVLIKKIKKRLCNKRNRIKYIKVSVVPSE